MGVVAKVLVEGTSNDMMAHVGVHRQVIFRSSLDVFWLNRHPPIYV